MDYDKDVFAKAVALMEEIAPEVRVELSLDYKGKIKLCFFTASDDERREVQCYALRFVPKLENTGLGWWDGDHKDVSVTIYVTSTCKIVGYKIEEKDVLVPSGEKEQARLAITDCDLRKGKYTQADIDEPVEPS